MMRRDMRIIIALLAALIIIAVVLTVVGVLLNPGYQMDWMDGMMDASWGWLMILGVILVPVISILIVVAIIMTLDSSRQDFPSSQERRRWEYGEDDRRRAIDILEQRFARGEITREEYISMLDDLRRR